MCVCVWVYVSECMCARLSTLSYTCQGQVNSNVFKNLQIVIYFHVANWNSYDMENLCTVLCSMSMRYIGIPMCSRIGVWWNICTWHVEITCRIKINCSPRARGKLDFDLVENWCLVIYVHVANCKFLYVENLCWESAYSDLGVRDRFSKDWPFWEKESHPHTQVDRQTDGQKDKYTHSLIQRGEDS